MKRGRLELYPHQVQGVDAIVNGLLHGHIGGKPTNAFLLHDEMGLGKTIQAIEAGKRLQLTLPTLVVCPASCEQVWIKENPEARVYSAKGEITGMVVISYDMLRNLFKYYIEEKFPQGALSNEELIRFCCIHGRIITERIRFLKGDDLRRELLDISRSIKYKGAKSSRGNYASFMRQEWGLLILDEVHRIRSSSSGVAKAVGFMKAKYRLGLSGTPIVNGGHDLLTIWRYGLALFDLDWMRIKEDPNSDYCREIINVVSLGRQKDSVEGLALPKRDKTQEDIVFDWYNDLDQKRAYIAIKTESIAYLRDMENLKNGAGRHRLVMQQTFLGKMQRLRQVCLHKDLPNLMKGEKIDQVLYWTPASHQSFPRYTRKCVFALLCGIHRHIPLGSIRKRIVEFYVQLYQGIIPSPKMIYVSKMLYTYPERKIVVFCTFRVFLEKMMRKWLKQIGVRSAIFSGGSKSYQRQALEAFEHDDTVRVLLIVKGAGSEGLNLHCASICIIMDPHFNLAMDEQAAQRIDRIGQQTSEVIIRRLYMRGSIDEAMKMLQNDKQSEVKSWKSGASGSARSLKAQSLFLQKRDTVL